MGSRVEARDFGVLDVLGPTAYTLNLELRLKILNPEPETLNPPLTLNPKP